MVTSPLYSPSLITGRRPITRSQQVGGGGLAGGGSLFAKARSDAQNIADNNRLLENNGYVRAIKNSNGTTTAENTLRNSNQRDSVLFKAAFGKFRHHSDKHNLIGIKWIDTENERNPTPSPCVAV